MPRFVADPGGLLGEAPHREGGTEGWLEQSLTAQAGAAERHALANVRVPRRGTRGG